MDCPKCRKDKYSTHLIERNINSFNRREHICSACGETWTSYKSMYKRKAIIYNGLRPICSFKI